MSGTLAVVSQTGESLSFFDLASGERTAQITSLTSEPHELCFDPKRNLIYVSHTYRFGHYWKHGDYSHEISVVDAVTKQIVKIMDTRPAKGPHGLYIDHEHDVLYVSVEQLPNEEEGGGVIGIDLDTHKVIKQVPSHFTSHWFVMTPGGRKAYTCNKTASFISVLDLENEKMIGKIDVPGCEEPSISPDGRYVYFPTPGFKGGYNPENPAIKVIDTTTDTIVKSVPLSKGVLPIHVTSQGTILAGQFRFGEKTEDNFIHPSEASLGVYDGQTHEFLGEIPVDLMPLTVRSTPDGKVGFAANVSSGTVTVVDLVDKKVIRTLEVDDKKRDDKPVHVGAHGLAYFQI